MDLTKPVTYRGVDVNDLDPLVPNSPLSGFVTSEARLPPVDGWGYKEKRSLTDGYDASDVYLGMRTINLRGTAYGESLAALVDKVRLLRAVFTPTLAFGDDPGAKGYLPLYFSWPTLDTEDWDDGTIPVFCNVRPSEQPASYFLREANYGTEEGGFSMPWEATLEAIDPLFYAQERLDVPIDQLNASSVFVHRGDYPAPLNLIISVPGTDTVKKIMTFTGAGTSMTVTVPSDTNTRILRVDAEQKVVSYEVSGTQTLRMDLVEFASGFTYPRIQPGTTAYDWTISGGLPDPALSKFFWYETFI